MSVRAIAFSLLSVAWLAVACRSGQADIPTPSLIGTSWRAQEIDGRRVLERPDSTLVFEDARRVTGHTACNRYFGALALHEDTIRLKPAGTTRRACPPAVMDQESRFLGALGAATTFRLEGGTLLLLDENGRVRVRFVAQSPGTGKARHVNPPTGGYTPTPLERMSRTTCSTRSRSVARVRGHRGRMAGALEPGDNLPPEQAPGTLTDQQTAFD